MAETGFALINLSNQDAFVFQFFPNEDRTTDRANWTPQETTTGVKPLFYGNREPRQLQFSELYLDSDETGETTLTPEIRKLQALLEETEEGGTPPPLLAVWGDRRERCVLEDLTIESVLFNTEGNPSRIRVELSLVQLQPASEATTVRVGT